MAYDIVWSDVTDMALTAADGAALGAAPLSKQTLLLARVNTELSSSFFGGDDAPKYKLARIYLAAHMALVNGISQIASESEGGVSRSYATLPVMGTHNTTEYGRLFDDLVLSSPYRIGVRL